ncbi:MAG: hypothetical protein HYZ63_02260 [Candidatus Andersenbacteria bacterium]|nr:hypothetical protein [Candidatus Andersenbacteria bacterium]
MKYIPLFSVVLVVLFTAGAVLLLVFLGAVTVGWFDRAMYLYYVRTILLVLLGMLGFTTLLSFAPRVIQWMGKRMENIDEQSGNKPPLSGQDSETVASLSREEARQWLDDFLIEQQKPVHQVSDNQP